MTTYTDTTNSKNDMNIEEQLALLDEQLDKVLDYDVEKRIKKMFFDVIPNGTILYSTDSEYETQAVAEPIDCAVCDYDSDCDRFVKAVKFKVENGELYAIECLSDDEDEICDCFWNLDYFPANYKALSSILSLYKSGNHSEEDVALIPKCEAEDEDQD